ncbi:MAG TPA: adenosylcobinamide-GDP ribazoletransferase [Acidimicrobiales bacterium]|nr:adenosylcobinamide-GDP ribazoletransferase [Acidimicrobiales bacterium]
MKPDGLAQAVAFLTAVGRGRRPTPGAVPWFPVVGAALGLLLGLVWWGAAQVWPPFVAAAVVVAVDLALTGLLHLDGLVDSADGLLPHLDRERRLAVMRAPDTGAFGVGAAIAVLLLRWSALGAMSPHPLLLGGLWCASRTGMALTLGLVPYARNEGIARDFTGGAGHTAPLVLAGAGALALAAGWSVPAGPAAGAAAFVAFGAVVLLGFRRLGGFTGDVLGAAGLVAETVGLGVAAARW